MAAGDGGVLDGVEIGARRHRADGADDGSTAALGRLDESGGTGRDDVDDRHAELVAQLVEAGRGGSVAGDDEGLDAVVGDQAGRQFLGEAAHLVSWPWAVGYRAVSPM